MPATPPPAPIRESPRTAALRRLWVRMTAIYGHRWASAYGESCENPETHRMTIAGDTWQRGLAGVSEQAIAVGLEACVMSADPWPPTLPQFRAMCLGIPSLAEVKADMRHLSHDRQPFTRMVWGHLDAFGFSRADQDRADRMLRDAYEQAREAVMRGEPMPERAAGAIEAPAPEKRKPAPPEVVKQHLDHLAEVLGGDETEGEDQP